MILNRYIYINQIVFKCVTSKKALNHFFECTNTNTFMNFSVNFEIRL